MSNQKDLKKADEPKWQMSKNQKIALLTFAIVEIIVMLLYLYGKF